MRQPVNGVTSASRTYAFVSDRTLGMVLLAILFSHVLDGPLRFGLYLLHAESLLYLRDVAGFAVVGLVLVAWLGPRAYGYPLVAATALLLVHFLIGVLSLRSAIQPLFGFKICASVLVGIAAAPLIRDRTLVRIARWVFILTVLGVLGNQFLEYPWIGMSYNTTFGETQGSRLWWQAGATRLPGLTRASFCAASYVLVSLVPLYLHTGWRGRLLLLLSGSYVFVMTTTKGTWFGLVAFLLGDALLTRRGSLRAFALFASTLTFGCVLVPLLLVASEVPLSRAPEWTLSFMQRIEDMWPGAMALLAEPEEWLWGRGLGGIGVAQGYGDRLAANSADNLMLYLIVTFGFAGILYGMFPLWRVLRRLSEAVVLPASSAQRCIAGWWCAWVAYGYVANMLEEPVLAMTVGIVLMAPRFDSEQPLPTATAQAPRAIRLRSERKTHLVRLAK